MTKPRYVVPGQFLMLTRRTHSREFTLRPDKDLTQLVKYLVAVGIERFDLHLIAATVMSTHYHLVVEDVRGNYPAFLHWLNGTMAHAVNRLRGRSEGLWAAAQTEATLLADPAAVLKEAAYALANPVQDGAVSRGSDWPGLRTAPDACRKPPERIARPQVFPKDSKLPLEAHLVVRRPRTHAAMTDNQFAGLLGTQVGHREAAARVRIKSEGRHFSTARAAERIPWTQRATRPETTGPKNTPNEVVYRDAQSGAELKARLINFRATYAHTRHRWLGGNRDVIWPAGTWLMRYRHRLPCDAPPGEAARPGAPP